MVNITSIGTLGCINIIITLIIVINFKNSSKFLKYKVSIFLGSIAPFVLMVSTLIGLNKGVDEAYSALLLMTSLRMISMLSDLSEYFISSEDSKMIRINEIILIILNFVGVMCGIWYFYNVYSAIFFCI